jgi:DHA1 family bicyclomycin/chloramphenicol resistance-like MFS transporter
VAKLKPVSPQSLSRGKAIALIGAVQTLQPLTLDPYLPSVKVIASDFAVNPSVIQLTLSSVTLGFALGMLIAGPLSDSLGRRRPLLIAMAVYLGATLLCAIFPNVAVFFAMRMLQGLSAAAVLVVGNAMIRDLFDGLALIKAISRSMLIMAASWFLGPFMGSLFLYFTNWRGVAAIMAGITALLFLLGLRSLPETLHVDNRKEKIFSGMLHRFGAVLRDRQYTGLLGISVCFVFAIFSYLNVTPFVYGQEFGVSSTGIGLFMGLNSVASYTGVQVSSKLSQYIAPQWVLTGVIACSGLLGLWILLISKSHPSLLLAAGLIFVYVFFFGASITPNNGLALAPHGSEAGTAAALMSVTGYLITTAAGPFYTGLDKTNLSGVGATVLVMMTIAMALMIFVVRPRTVAALKR